MNKFEQFSSTEISRALANIDAPTVPDIYALSFFIEDKDDDPRYPVLKLGYNTLTHFTESTAWASDAEEAKWNFAFWLQNDLACIGGPGTPGGELFAEWMTAQGLWYTDEEENADFDRCTRLGSAMTACFVEAAVRIARTLHANGTIRQYFPQPVPILVHELEYYDEIARQTQSANPPGLAQAFENWIASLY